MADKPVFRVHPNPLTLFTRLSASDGEGRQPGPSILRIRQASDQAVGFQPIDQLRDVRLHAGETFGQLTQRQRIPGIPQDLQQQQLRERQANLVELGFDLVLRGVRDAYALEELEAILGTLEEFPVEPVVPLPVRIEAFRFAESEEHVLKSVTKPMSIAEIVKANKKYATREEALRAIFCGLSCDLLRSPRWKQFTAVSPLGD